MTYRVGVGINSFDDPKGLIKILTNDRLYDFIDTFFIFEGRYKERQDPYLNDPDYVYDIKSIYKKIHLRVSNNYSQIEKRNWYWEEAEKANLDYMIVCDTDEFIDINPPVFESSLRIIDKRPEKCYPIQTHMQDVMTMFRPRLFKAPFTFRHRKSETTISHGSLWEDYGESDKEVIQQMYAWFKDHEKRDRYGNQLGIPGITMWHDKQHRTHDRIIADRVYYDEVKNR